MVQAAALPSTPGSGATISVVRDLLQRPDGCQLPGLIAATDWQPQTIGAAVSGRRRKEHRTASFRVTEGSRTSPIVPGDPSR